MIVDLNRGGIPGSARHIIVGSGAVGLTLAVLRARRGERVVVVESGGHGFSSEAQKLNASEILGRHHTGIHEGRARVLGGTTNLWGGQLVPFGEIDFEARPWIGAEPWPIGFDDLRPHYAAISELLGLDQACESDDDVWRTLNIVRPTLDNFNVILTRWLREPALAELFRNELKTLPNLTVVLNAHCTNLLFGADVGTIAGVEIQSLSGSKTAITAEVVTIANGSIEASRLMMLTAARHPEAPWAGSYWLGRGFQDHLDVRAAQVLPIDRKRFSNAFETISLRGFKYAPKIALTAEAQRAHRLTNVASQFEYDSSIGEDLGKIKAAARSILRGVLPRDGGASLKALAGTAKVWLPLIIRFLKDRRVRAIADRGIYLMLHCEQIALADSRVRLSETQTDPFGQATAALDWRVDGREIESMRFFARELGREFEAQGLARIVVDPELDALDPAFLERCVDTNHHCGGLRMSSKPSEGVVDPDQRVHGMRNLYVAGAAVFPSSSFANPTFTAMAMTHRLAQHLSSNHADHQRLGG